MTIDAIKPAVRALRAYSLSPYRASVKLNQNENPWDAPARIKEEVLRRFERARGRDIPTLSRLACTNGSLNLHVGTPME